VIAGEIMVIDNALNLFKHIDMHIYFIRRDNIDSEIVPASGGKSMMQEMVVQSPSHLAGARWL
jgi:hypothetical protein